MTDVDGRPAPTPTDDGKITDLLADARRWAVRVDRPDLLLRLEAAAARLATPVCQIVVLGEFKKGKSSLLNALLNARVCPTDADIATAVPNYLRYGEKFSATSLSNSPFEQGSTGQPRPPGRGLDAGAAESAARGELGGEIHALQITLPRELLRAGLALVDTPGMGGGLASSHAAVALRALATADVVLFVADAGSEFSAPELELLDEAQRLCPRVICAITKTDLYPEWRRIIEVDRVHLNRAGITAPLIPLSAPLRHHGLRDNDDELIRESGFPQLTAELLAAATSTSGSAGASATAVVLSTMGQIRAELSGRRRSLAGSEDDPVRARAAQAARSQAIELRSAGAAWQQVLTDRIDDLHGEVELDLTKRLRQIRKDAADHIRATTPSRLPADLPPWLQQQTNQALLEHVRRLRDEVEAVADAVAEKFGNAAWELRSGIDLEATHATGAAARDVLAPALEKRVTQFDVGLAALRGGATGAMVTHVVGIVVGIAFPIVLPAAVALSSVLAGKSWQSARSSQLRMLRAEAERSVAVYLEEVDTIARKDSRDALRQTRRYLREAFGERSREMYSTAMRTAEELEANRTKDKQERERQLQAVDAELTQISGLTTRAKKLIDSLVPRS